MLSHAAKTHRPLVIAHRGASGLAPENTMAAFRLAAAMGADGFELDVQLSADGQPVVIHDARLNRTTDRVGAVASLTAAELAACDAGAWFARRLARRPRIRAMAERVAELTKADGKGFAGEAVPALGDILALAATANVKRVYVELKGSRWCDKQPLLDAVLALSDQYKMARAVTLLSFDHEIIRRAKVVAPRLRTAATFAIPGRGELTARAIISAVERAQADEAALHYGLATRRTVAALHARGLTVAVWTVNSKLLMRRMLAVGVDAIMTNYPNRLSELIERA
ncbi:MAG TPA: glycerophosphodiester phosphodiesterase family protein [Blastocatellia bacterium]|nr:glycerophosphodiester phosphodiesterase family protein [Blastocatellia bacterium]